MSFIFKRIFGMGRITEPIISETQKKSVCIAVLGGASLLTKKIKSIFKVVGQCTSNAFQTFQGNFWAVILALVHIQAPDRPQTPLSFELLGILGLDHAHHARNTGPEKVWPKRTSRYSFDRKKNTNTHL